MKLSEHDEQVAFVQWLEAKKFAFSAIPNSFFLPSNKKSFAQIAKFKNEGWRIGLPDILVIVPCWDGKKRIVFIEMKRKDQKPKKNGMGGVKKEQMVWKNALNACEEVHSAVCYGCEEAIKEIEKFL